MQGNNYAYGQVPTQQQQQQPSEENLQFQSFSYANQGDPYAGRSFPSHSSFTPPPSHLLGPTPVTWGSIRAAFSSNALGNEPPLLEELGINFDHILKKGYTVLNPFLSVDRHLMDDTDLAGPVLFLFLFGAFLRVSGRAHFEYTYGVALVGVLSVYGILNLMSEEGVDGYRTASVLGYALLPMVIFSSLSVLLQLSGQMGLLLSVLSIIWCTHSASIIFTTVLAMSEQRLLVAYPIALVYSAFALLVLF